MALDPLGCDNSSGLPASSFGFAPSPPFALAPRASRLSSARLAEPPVVLSARGAQAVAFTERPIKGGKKGGSIVPNVSCLSSKSFSFFIVSPWETSGSTAKYRHLQTGEKMKRGLPVR